MNEFHVIHVINSLGVGGAEKQLSILLQEIDCFGLQQQVFPLVGRRCELKLQQRISVFPTNGVFAFFNAMRHAVCLGRSHRTVLVAWMYHSWLIAVLAHLVSGRRSKIFFYCRHGDPKSLRWTTKFLALFLLRYARKLDIPVVFNSCDARDLHLAWVPNLNSRVIENAIVDVGLQKLERGCTISFLGRNHPDKGADQIGIIAVKLLARLPGWRFVAAGPGMAERGKEIFQAVAAAGIDVRRVEILDAVQDTAGFLIQSDLIVMPSRTESFPNVLAEAMMLGVPVAAMDVGGVKGILDGALPAARNLEELIDLAASICLADETTLIELRHVLRNKILRRYSPHAIAMKHVQLWGATAQT